MVRVYMVRGTAVGVRLRVVVVAGGVRVVAVVEQHGQVASLVHRRHQPMRRCVLVHALLAAARHGARRLLLAQDGGLREHGILRDDGFILVNQIREAPLHAILTGWQFLHGGTLT